MKDALFKKKGFFLPSPPDVAHLPPNVLITPFRLYFFLGESVGGEKLINNLDAKEKKTLFSALERETLQDRFTIENNNF